MKVGMPDTRNGFAGVPGSAAGAVATTGSMPVKPEAGGSTADAVRIELRGEGFPSPHAEAAPPGAWLRFLRLLVGCLFGRRNTGPATDGVRPNAAAPAFGLEPSAESARPLPVATAASAVSVSNNASEARSRLYRTQLLLCGRQERSEDVAAEQTLCGDMRGQALIGWDFSGITVPNGSFEHARLIDIDLSNAGMAGADFDMAAFYDVSFRATSLRGATMRNIEMGLCDFTGADLDGAALTLGWRSLGRALREDGLRNVADSVRSIDDQYADIKRGLVLQIRNGLTAQLNRAGPRGHVLEAAVENLLLNHPLFAGDPAFVALVNRSRGNRQARNAGAQEAA
jgi:hypothetical protein